MTPIEAKKLVIILLATFPSAKVEPPALDASKNPIPNTGTAAVYERLLADLDPIVAAAAIDRVAAIHRFPTILPSIAEIREAALTIAAGEVRTGLEAWGDVEQLMRRGFSSHKAPKESDLADPIVFDCIRDVGWRVLCMTSEEDSSPRARFIDSYDARAARARRTTLTASLPAVRRALELRAGAADQHELAASTASTRRAMLELAAHPDAKNDPEAQRAIRAAQEDLRRRGAPQPDAAGVADLVSSVLARGGGR